MFKRMNKITALLVAAAAVVSIVPATGVSAAGRLGTKDGTINKAIAYDGGKYIYDGYRTDEDDTGIYYNAGEKDKAVEDLEDYTLDNVSKYGSKYAYATKSGNDDYLIDLSSGKVIDDESAEEKIDTAKSKLKSALKKTDRYSNTNIWDDVKVKNIDNLQGQFGDVWYQYSAKGDGVIGAETTSAAAKAEITIGLPTKGTVLDLSNGKKVTIGGETYTKADALDRDAKKFNTLEELKDLVIYYAGEWLDSNLDGIFDNATYSNSDNVVTIKAKDFEKLTNTQISKIKEKYGKNSVVNSKTATNATDSIVYTGFVNQNGKYIDASNLANIYVYSTKSGKVVKVEEFNDLNKDDNVKVTLNSLDVLAQDKDNIYAVADVNITGSKITSAKYLQKISKAQGEKKEQAYVPKSVTSYQIDDQSLYDNGDVNDAYTAILKDDDGYEVEDNQYRVKNNTLYVTRTKSDKVKIFKLKLTKIKENAVSDIGESKKLDGYVVKKDGDSDHDIVKTGKEAVSIDADGNTWALDKGSIVKYNGSDWKEIYSVDRSLDALDVYNEGSLVAYEKHGDVYTTVQEGKAVTDTEAAPAQTGWVNTATGWTFYDAAGKQVVGSWINAGGVWYMIKADGIMATGWYNDNGTWYYLNESGAMQTGWFNSNGTWYYLQSSGAMKTGWLNDNGTWYYLQASGAMAANTTVDGYVLNASGAWVK